MGVQVPSSAPKNAVNFNRSLPHFCFITCSPLTDFLNYFTDTVPFEHFTDVMPLPVFQPLCLDIEFHSVVVPLKVTCLRLEQLLKAELSIKVMPTFIVTEVSAVQPENALKPIHSQSLKISTVVNDVQFLNISEFDLVPNFTVFSPVQPLKISVPVSLMFEGTVMEVKPVAPANAPLSILIIPEVGITLFLQPRYTTLS